MPKMKSVNVPIWKQSRYGPEKIGSVRTRGGTRGDDSGVNRAPNRELGFITLQLCARLTSFPGAFVLVVQERED